MSPRFVLGRENVPCIAEVVNRSLKADLRPRQRPILSQNKAISVKMTAEPLIALLCIVVVAFAL